VEEAFLIKHLSLELINNKLQVDFSINKPLEVHLQPKLQHKLFCLHRNQEKRVVFFQVCLSKLLRLEDYSLHQHSPISRIFLMHNNQLCSIRICNKISNKIRIPNFKLKVLICIILRTLSALKILF